MGWPDGILMDGTNVVSDAQAGNTYVSFSIISGSVIDNFKSTDAVFQSTMPTWFTNFQGRTFDTNDEIKLVSPFDLNNFNPMPKNDSPVLTGADAPPNDGFFDSDANFVGAFKNVDWTSGWSSLNIKVVGVEDEQNGIIPTTFTLNQNYPNPFNPTTTIKFSVPQSGNVRLTVYNALGQEITQLVNEQKTAGNYSVEWNAANVSSGIYFYQLESGNIVITKKMALLK